MIDEIDVTSLVGSIMEWRKNFTNRAEFPQTDIDNLEKGREYFGKDVSLAQYQAFVAFAEIGGVQILNGESDDNIKFVLRNTMGTQHDGVDGEGLIDLLDRYSAAACEVYDQELSASLSIISD